ncbi:substrate-binding domain-containing protein [Actimicrobium sp. CCC2.4]|uniref:substrate-binding domain-containing protein n=1 Tax=Actimicrobium sp. CCC2.4 TaxID=3048606 RepID=UPI002AC90CB3|nr:substrate-binding domain-containing protein [Actimicrobium sp. CCC2.4]MEB0136564.1 substrate-binding domain-containing protein [Actimicrobium sp. CCC2.4]WPX31750.1 substrate-binding domain-containing protein [Actimicrobium sp. CCC2.4]
MFKVTIHPHWEIVQGAKNSLDTTALLALLRAIEQGGSIAQAAKSVQVSYRHAWGLLKDAEVVFGQALMHTQRGRGTVLSPLAQKLLWADRRIAARLSPTLESLASELESELGKLANNTTGAVRLDASHGFAVAALLNQLHAIELPVELRYRNSTDAVTALARRECHLAGFHVPLGPFEHRAAARYLHILKDKEHCLIHLAVRRQGLFVNPDNPLHITGLDDLQRHDLRFVNRQAGSGTRALLELMLADSGIPTSAINGFQNSEFTHSAVAAYIASGMADVGFGVQTAAERFGLTFIPLVRERYFFAIEKAAMDLPLIRQVLSVIRSEAYRASVNALAGYEAGDTGKVLSLDEAFGQH